MKKERNLGKQIWQNRMCYIMIAPFMILFLLFIILPILMAVYFSFTDFNLMDMASAGFVGIENYIRMFLDDEAFMTSVRNTLLFAVITGPVSYFACLIMAWLVNEMNPKIRSVLTFIYYAPTISGMVYVMWTYIFSGDMYGLLNNVLMSLGLITEPIQWLTDPDYMLGVVIFVQLWMSLGTSFLSYIAGLQNVDKQLYEAAAIDGVKNRFQELIYITLPSMGPQLLFGAVMQIGAAFSVSQICMTLVGFPSVDNAALTTVTHIYDMGNIHYEMGYACAMSTVLFLFVLLVNNIIQSFIKKHAEV